VGEIERKSHLNFSSKVTMFFRKQFIIYTDL